MNTYALAKNGEVFIDDTDYGYEAQDDNWEKEMAKVDEAIEEYFMV